MGYCICSYPKNRLEELPSKPKELVPTFMSTSISLTQIVDYLINATLPDLHTLLNEIQMEIPKREGQTKQYVTQIEDFCADKDLLSAVWTECQSMEMPSKKSRTGTLWLSEANKDYVYSDTDPVHKRTDIKEFPAIHKLLSVVNTSTEVDGHLDSCLILKYNSNAATVRLHSDEEAMIDQSKSICSFSLGCERTIEFWQKSQKPKLVQEFRMKQNTMVVMRPGTQQNLKHTVRPEANRPPADPDNPDSNIRYCLSFRAVAPDKPPITPSQSSTETKSPPETRTPKKRVCLIAGDSFAARMDTIRLGKGKLIVDNIAQGGAKISKVIEQLSRYREANPDNEVQKIILSVGTNDIRNAQNGVAFIKSPLKALCENIGKLFPESVIFFQSLLPLPLKSESDWNTNKNVMSVNRIIYNECKFRKFHFIGAFYEFCKFNRKFNEPYRRFDRLFEENGVHPNTKIGMGVLGRMYIKALHKFRMNFEPLVFQ